jgi:cbb3-type cytochrome oxidase maturation protein
VTALAWLLPTALGLGALGLAAFLWSLRAGQFEDLEGAAYRALDDEPPEQKPAQRQRSGSSAGSAKGH